MLKTIDIPDVWRKPLILLLVLLGVFSWTFSQSWLSIINIWQRSGTYAHGFLVLPASLWLIWGRREYLKQIQPAPSYLALIALLAAGFVWMAAVLSKALVVEQFALVAMLISVVWMILGDLTALNIMFPLLFLFLMVPFGEDFVPYLVEYTVSFIVAMLRLTGVSVYREGTYLTLTSGQWSVIEACSGIRYLIASFTLGLIYAYINYSSYIKRSIFILLSVLVPILANGIRAYMIVMIGHLSSMKLATGVDHIIYGWVFFGLVMLLLFYIGSFWQDEPIAVAKAIPEGVTMLAVPTSKFAVAFVVVLISVSIWPITTDVLANKQKVQASIPSNLFKNMVGQVDSEPDWDWRPKFKGVVAESLSFVKVDGQVTGIYLANFGNETQGGELVNSRNLLSRTIDKRSWHVIESQVASLDFSTGTASVEESIVRGNLTEFLVFRWYRIGERNTANTYYAKWLQLWKRLIGDSAPELMVVLYAQTQQGDYLPARERLKNVAEACCR